MWQENIDAQVVLDAHATKKYMSSNITKMDRPMTNDFKQIKEEATHDNSGKVETIHKLENTLLNMQQMSIREAIHIVLSLPLIHVQEKQYS